MFRKSHMTAAACAALLLVTAGRAEALPVIASTSAFDWDRPPTSSGGDPVLDDLTLTLLGLPTNANSDLSVTFRLRADLNVSSENVRLSIDGVSFGVWLDNNLFNDTIADGVSDTGDQNRSIFTGIATIPLAGFLPLIADGRLDALFDFSPSVDDLAVTGFQRPEFAGFTVRYSTSDVPEPTSMVLFGLTVLGMGIVARRRRRKALTAETTPMA